MPATVFNPRLIKQLFKRESRLNLLRKKRFCSHQPNS